MVDDIHYIEFLGKLKTEIKKIMFLCIVLNLGIVHLKLEFTMLYIYTILRLNNLG